LLAYLFRKKGQRIFRFQAVLARMENFLEPAEAGSEFTDEEEVV